MRSMALTVERRMARCSPLLFAAQVGLVLALILPLNGCMTLIARYQDPSGPPENDPHRNRIRVYSGTHLAIEWFGAENVALFAFLDLPLSFVADTIILPLTIYEEFSGQLHKAAWRGDIDTVKVLLDKGVDVNERYDFRRTALMNAAWNSQEAVVQLLLDRGADVNAMDRYGDTALKIARKRGHTALVDLLMNRGAKKE